MTAFTGGTKIYKLPTSPSIPILMSLTQEIARMIQSII